MLVKINVIAGPANGKVFVFDKPDCFLFGRASDARLSLPDDPFVSRQHFLLEISPPKCMVTDLGSKNGLFINEVRYGGRRPAGPETETAPDGVMGARLTHGDQIAVGNTIMTISIEAGNLPLECEALENGKTFEIPVGSIQGKPDSVELIEELLKQAAEPQAVPDAPTFKGYYIQEEIGHGSMGTVYKAVEELTGWTVAIKTMKPNMAVKEDSIRMFRREVEVTRQLKHKNIVELLEYGKTANTFYFVIEYVEGMDLDKYVQSKGGRMDLDSETARIMLQTLEGLAYAHKVKIKSKTADGKMKTYTGIVHRDIKPDNILLSSNETHGWIPKISDFGLSKSFESAGLSDITIPGMVAGTPVYWPREQITHYRYLNPATDVFSIAAVFYEALTGSLVRNGFDIVYAVSKHKKRTPRIADFMRVLAENPPIPIRKRRCDIPQPVADVIDRALQETEVPSDKHGMRNILGKLRFPNAEVFHKELLKAFKKSGIKL